MAQPCVLGLIKRFPVHPMPLPTMFGMDYVISRRPHPHVRGAFIEKMASGFERCAPVRPESRVNRRLTEYLYRTAGCRPSTARRLTRHVFRDHGWSTAELPGLAAAALINARPRERRNRSGRRTAASRAAPSSEPHLPACSKLEGGGDARRHVIQARAVPPVLDVSEGPAA